MLTDPSGLVGSSNLAHEGIRRAAIDATRVSSSPPRRAPIAL